MGALGQRVITTVGNEHDWQGRATMRGIRVRLAIGTTPVAVKAARQHTRRTISSTTSRNDRWSGFHALDPGRRSVTVRWLDYVRRWGLMGKHGNSKHPSRNCYQKHHCRCPRCVRIECEYTKNLRNSHRGMGDHEGHPSVRCYNNHYCRCIDCKLLEREYRQRRRRRKIVIVSIWLPRSGTRPPLSEKELARLRKMVGFDG